MTVRSRALGAGLAVALVYAATAIVSGHLSPLSSGPLLDGLAPPTAYRWVKPPPELAATNQKPTPGTFTVKLGNDGSKTAVFTTDDAQVTVILPEGSFADAEGQRSVQVAVDPLAGAIAHPDDPLHVVGNVYLVEATYQPSGDAAKLANLATVVIVYPLLANDHGSHSIIWSRSGRTMEGPRHRRPAEHPAGRRGHRRARLPLGRRAAGVAHRRVRHLRRRIVRRHDRDRRRVDRPRRPSRRCCCGEARGLETVELEERRRRRR